MSDSIDSEQPENSDQREKGPDVEVSQSRERDAVLAAVLREQTEKAEVQEQEREVRVRRQGLGSRHVALSFATVLSLWIWIAPPGGLRITPPGPPPWRRRTPAFV